MINHRGSSGFLGEPGRPGAASFQLQPLGLSREVLKVAIDSEKETRKIIKGQQKNKNKNNSTKNPKSSWRFKKTEKKQSNNSKT